LVFVDPEASIVAGGALADAEPLTVAFWAWLAVTAAAKMIGAIAMANDLRNMLFLHQSVRRASYWPAIMAADSKPSDA